MDEPAERDLLRLDMNQKHRTMMLISTEAATVYSWGEVQIFVIGIAFVCRGDQGQSVGILAWRTASKIFFLEVKTQEDLHP